MQMTRIFSLTPGTPGRRQQMPRTIRSILTPAHEASYSALMIFSSTSELIFAMIRPGLPRSRVVALTLDQLPHPPHQVEWRDHQLFEPGIRGEARQRIEQRRQLLGELRLGREEAQVGVNARRARMIIPGAQVRVMADAVLVPPHDQQRLAMRLQPHQPVHHVRARLLEHPRPVDIVRLVEARLQLHQRDHLLAVLRRVDQRLYDGRVAAGAVERHLDRQHLRVGRRRLDQLDDAVEGLVGMVQQHVFLAQQLPHVPVRRQVGVVSGDEGPVLQLCKRLVGRERQQVRHRQRAGHLVKVGLAAA